MKIILSSFISLTLLVWGATEFALNSPSLEPWAIYQQALYLSGLLAMAMLSMAMVLAARPRFLEHPLGGAKQLYSLHKWCAIGAALFAVSHWLLEMSDDWVEALTSSEGLITAGSLFAESLQDAGEEVGEVSIYLLLAMVAVSLWRRFPRAIWRPLHRGTPVLYLLLAFHALVLSPAYYWTLPLGPFMAALLIAGAMASVKSLRQSSRAVISAIKPTPPMPTKHL